MVGGRVSTAGTMLPETFKKVESEIGNQASRYADPRWPASRNSATRPNRDPLRQQVGRADPSAADAIKAAAFQGMGQSRPRGLVTSAPEDGVFTRPSFNTAIQAADQSVRKGRSPAVMR